MKRLFPFFALILLLGTAAKPTDKDAAAFRRPANEYRPMPFWHLNGTLTRDTIVKQINRAKREAGFGGIAVLPVSGTRPEYLTDAYFERYDDMIETMHRNGMELIITTTSISRAVQPADDCRPNIRATRASSSRRTNMSLPAPRPSRRSCPTARKNC